MTFLQVLKEASAYARIGAKGFGAQLESELFSREARRQNVGSVHMILLPLHSSFVLDISVQNN